MTHVPDFNDSIRLLKKIKEFTANDLRNSMFCAKANFLVALGILSYMEFLGGLLMGSRSNGDSFSKWLEYMGGEYEKLNGKDVYDQLRCGLVHEYMVKKKRFTIYGSDRILSDDEMRNCVHEGRVVDCGIKLINSEWHIYTPKLYIDFVDKFEKYIAELESDQDKVRVNNFKKRVKEINLDKFS